MKTLVSLKRNFMSNKTLISTMVIGTFFASTAGVQAGSLVIDDFSQLNVNPQQILNAGTAGTILQDLDTGLNTDNVIGGSRLLTLESVFNGVPGTLRSNLNVFTITTPPVSRLSWSNDTFVQSLATVDWDANGAGLNADLTGFDSIDLEVISIDLDAVVTWTLTDNNGITGTASATNLSPNTIVDFSFATDFTFDPGFNFNEVDKVSLILDSNEVDAVDASFDLVSFGMPEVPEPSTVLGILGITVLGRSLKRKNKDDQEK